MKQNNKESIYLKILEWWSLYFRISVYIVFNAILNLRAVKLDPGLQPSVLTCNVPFAYSVTSNNRLKFLLLRKIHQTLTSASARHPLLSTICLKTTCMPPNLKQIPGNPKAKKGKARHPSSIWFSHTAFIFTHTHTHQTRLADQPGGWPTLPSFRKRPFGVVFTRVKCHIFCSSIPGDALPREFYQRN